MHNHELEERLLEFSVRCTKLCRALPTSKYYDADHVAKQLLRAATHAGFHYPEARSAESTRDFLHKLKVLLKELREDRAELRYIQRMEYLTPDRVAPLIKESGELVAMFTAGTKKLSAKMVQEAAASKAG